MHFSRTVQVLWVLVFCLTMPAGVVIATHLARSSFERVRLGSSTVSVKGYAERRIVSDFARWETVIKARNPSLEAAHAKLEMDRAALIAILGQIGFAPNDVALSIVEVEPIRRRVEGKVLDNEIVAFELTQSAEVSAQDVERVARAARDSNALIGKGVELVASEPQYLCTQLGAMKLEMIGEATGNARERAEQILAGSGGRLGALRSASQGVFQVTPTYSTEVSSSGQNDTRSREKLIKAVVTCEYAIE